MKAKPIPELGIGTGKFKTAQRGFFSLAKPLSKVSLCHSREDGNPVPPFAVQLSNAPVIGWWADMDPRLREDDRVRIGLFERALMNYRVNFISLKIPGSKYSRQRHGHDERYTPHECTYNFFSYKFTV